jgi:hypothetical protein
MKQPTGMTCWATVGAMMMNWRAQVCRSIADAMAEAGPRWAQMFALGQGLGAAQHRQFARACGLRVEPLMCIPPSTWLRMLRRHGPLAVVTANPFHARIMRGLTETTGNPSRLFVRIIDPAGGRQYNLDFTRFNRDFEAVASSPRYQIWHF